MLYKLWGPSSIEQIALARRGTGSATYQRCWTKCETKIYVDISYLELNLFLSQVPPSCFGLKGMSLHLQPHCQFSISLLIYKLGSNLSLFLATPLQSPAPGAHQGMTSSFPSQCSGRPCSSADLPYPPFGVQYTRYPKASKKPFRASGESSSVPIASSNEAASSTWASAGSASRHRSDRRLWFAVVMLKERLAAATRTLWCLSSSRLLVINWTIGSVRAAQLRMC